MQCKSLAYSTGTHAHAKISAMLRLIRRHQKHCPLTAHSDRNCPGKVKCPIHLRGIDRSGRRVAESLGTRNWEVASKMLLKRELGEDADASTVTVEDAIKSFLQLKARQSIDTRRKNALLLERLRLFLERQGIFEINAAKLPDLVAFRDSWECADTTRRRDQEILKSFFKYCLNAEFIARDPAMHLDPVSVGRPKTEPFTQAEQMAIFNALAAFPDEYGRHGTAIATQTRAFVLTLRYTAMSIGDVAKLEKRDVIGSQIRTYRKKTGEDVFCDVPDFVIAALASAPHDSERYFFWSGEGKIHTRTSKWGERLQRLFVLAGVRTQTVQKYRRSGGRLKSEPETVTISTATPHVFRHSFARDFLESGGSMAELAELLGNSARTCEKYYSKWDRRRQERLTKNIRELRQNDPITIMLQEQLAKHVQ